MRAGHAIVLAIVCGCTGGATPKPEHARATPPSAPAPAAATPAASTPQPAAGLLPRVLGWGARFDDVVALARTLAERSEGDSTEGCLLDREGGVGYRLAADLLPAVRPLPDPPADLAPALAAGGRIRVLSHWDESGEGQAEPALVLASFTTVPATSARAPATALVVARAGVFLRYSDRDASPRDGPLTPNAFDALVQPMSARALYVTAERDMPLEVIERVLALLPLDRPVALAVALPPGTRLPHAAPAPGTNSHACPDGLPEPVAGAVEGNLAPADIAAALAPLRGGAARCVESARGAGSAGGKLTLALRIEPDGRVRDVCAVRDAIGDPALVACVIASVDELHLPVPAPAGFVDVHLPLDLAPVGPPMQRALCRPLDGPQPGKPELLAPTGGRAR